MKEEHWCLSGFVAALKFTNIKLTCSISVLFLLIFALGCGQGEQTSGKLSNDAIVEKIDRIAAAEFKELVEDNKDDIIRILEQNNILAANLPNPYKHINWHLYKSANLYIENGMGTAKIVLSGWEKSHENNYQKPVILWFERKDRSPEIHEAFTRLFPHIEYEDWYKWKEPVCKRLALIRLRTVTEPNQK